MKILKDQKTAINLLNEGGIGVLLTDTVYGLTAKATNPIAVARLYAAKNRESKPGVVIANNIKQLTYFGISNNVLLMANKYWPGPISIIINLSHDFNYLHQGVGSVAFRIVDDQRIQKILDATGPLVTTSANLPDMPISKNIHEAQEYFNNSIDFYLDNGHIENPISSTIIKLDDGIITLIRKGVKDID